jgi:hypothetical protein
MMQDVLYRKGSAMLDDLFEGSKHNRQRGHDDHDHYEGYGQGDRHYNPLLNVAQKLMQHKLLLIGIVVIFLCLCAAGLWLLIKLLPLFGQLLGLVEKQDIKGALDTIAPFVQKILGAEGK